jgi:hypothetical protein
MVSSKILKLIYLKILNFTVKLMLLLHLEKAFYIFARFHQLYEEMNRTLLEGLDILWNWIKQYEYQLLLMNSFCHLLYYPSRCLLLFLLPQIFRSLTTFHGYDAHPLPNCYKILYEFSYHVFLIQFQRQKDVTKVQAMLNVHLGLYLINLIKNF